MRSPRGFSGTTLATLNLLFLALISGTSSAQELSRLIDREIQAKLDAAKLPVSPIADDAEFLRRVYLDLVGVMPSADKVVSFLEDKDPKKRAKLIDELLKNPAYGQHFADIWGPMLILEKTFVRPPKPLFFQWFAQQFNKNRPWDELVFDILTATGESAQKNPAIGFLANELRTISPDLATNLITTRFLGVNIECAQCHEHPFASWSKEDYWGVANFFTQVKRTKTKGVKSRYQGLRHTVKRNRASTRAPKVAPKFLGGETPTLKEGVDPRVVFAKWATDAKNPFFARAMVNRTWAHFFGRGFVNPIDDMVKTRKPTHPRLLEKLTEEFVRSDFDLHVLVRAICNSHTYQRTSKITKGNGDDQELYSHGPVKMLTPEQLWNCYQALGMELSAMRNPDLHANLNLENFRTYLLNGDEEINPLEYKHGTTHALFFMNHVHLADRQKVLVRQLTTSAKTPTEMIDRLYLTVLARYPTQEQKEPLMKFVQSRSEKPLEAVYTDILWALLHSSEFTVNH